MLAAATSEAAVFERTYQTPFNTRERA